MSRTFTKTELDKIINDHRRWLRGLGDGRRADLTDAVLTDAVLIGADLTDAVLTDAVLTDAVLIGADLTDAVLIGADLTRADLTGADLTRADLTGAILTRANLTDAVLTGADLTRAKRDFYKILRRAPNEVAALLAKLREGGVDGSVYTGECACLVGTIANARGVSHTNLPGIVPNGSRPAERLFMAIRKGDTPQTNAVAKVVETWIVEWQERTAEKAATP